MNDHAKFQRTSIFQLVGGSEITVKQILQKLEQHHSLSMSRWTIQRHLHQMGYKNILPRITHMLMTERKEKRVAWAMKYKNDDWNRTAFSAFNYSEIQSAAGGKLHKKSRDKFLRASKR